MIQVVSQQQMKLSNTKSVFRLIQVNKNISRIAISKITKLSPTTISSIVDELMSKGIVVERLPLDNIGAGRKAISLEINDVKKYIIGMDLNQEGVTGTAFNLKMDPVFTIAERFNKKTLEDVEIIRLLKSIINKLMKAVKGDFNELLGVCIGIPALLDPVKQSIVISTALNIENIDLYHSLQAEFDFPIFFENETLVAATAEKEQYEKSTSPFIYLSINEGLGARVIINDQFLQGANGDSIEIGHMSVDLNGAQCSCGNRGCFELLVSTNVLAVKTNKAMANNTDSILSELMSKEGVSIESAIANAVLMNDPLAIQIVDEIAIDLGNGIVNVINIFNPEMIVIGGRLSTLGDRLLLGVQKQAEKRAIKPFFERCTIGLVKQRDNTISRGAAIYTLNRVIESQIN
ncbi:ROK family transcriptional regulator [Cohnella sp. WQ 127256]|uniref:ROK family transcriptional regulator n=1 Tax=Cohnella sp. WQ 127256 TaxID=2938790 RepID=UPI0021181D9D|nr:ROK family transcriptional regulator [Cohnella sp. WQ 127256]